MSRRAIRDMLLTPKTRPKPRRWLLPTLMAGVLAAGVGVGVGVGLLLTGDKPKPPPPLPIETSGSLNRSADDGLLRPAPEVPSAALYNGSTDFQPIIPLPPPRPGGPEDDGFDYGVDERADPDLVPPVPDRPPQHWPLPDESQSDDRARPPVTGTDSAPILPLPPPRPDMPASAEPPAPRTGQAGAWLRNAVLPPKIGNRPILAVIIDDMGVDKKRAERTTHLRAPLTLAWMTYAEDLPRATQAARAKGHELMVHMPMQPMADSFDAGRDVLRVDLPAEEIRRRVNWGLDRFPGYIGINNHMGSRFTTDPVGMRIVMEELRKRGLVFVDSVTSEKTVGGQTARQMGVPWAERHVFIDNIQSVASVTAQLNKAEDYARKHGMAIAIGHPHDATIDALTRWLPGLEQRGIVLVPVSTIIKRLNGGAPD